MKTTKKKHQETYKYKSIYEKAINKVFNNWKKEFVKNYNNCPSKDECTAQKTREVSDLIFLKSNSTPKDFGWLSVETNKRIQFYSHLDLIRKGELKNYSFLNRSVEGNKIGFDKHIPEIIAGALWKFYLWLLKDPLSFMFTLGEKAKCLTVPEAVYLCHFSEYPINLKNCQKIADHFGKQNGHSLYKEYKKNITSGDFTAGVNEKELDLKRINLLQNIIPLLSRKEHSITANNTLKKLKANYTNGLETGLYDELKKKNEQ